MKKKLLALLLLSPMYVMGMQRLSGWCEQGAKVVVAPATPGGPPISRSFQQSYPVCTVTVYNTGTTVKAAIFSTNSPNPTTLPNPFQANTFGYWDFYAANGHYDVQISGGGLPAPYTFGDQSLFDIIDYSPCPGCILSATGFISTRGQYNDYSTQTGGALFRALNILQTADGRSGGYIKLSPLTYNPNDGAPVFDQYGNPVRDPVYLPGDSLGGHDAVLFVAEATDLIPNPDLIFGIFTNQYMFSRVGFATDYASEASFQSLNGGMQALSFAAVNYVNSGQHAGTPPPLTNLDQFHPGAVFYDTLAGCEKVYNGSSWSCLGGGGGGGGTPGGPDTALQFNSANTFAGTADMTWTGSLKLLNINTLDSVHAGINVHNGFIQSDSGFVAAVGTTYNSVQSAFGGLAGRSVTVSTYVQTGNSVTTPTPSTGDSFHAGALYYDTTNNCESLYNGIGWSCLSGGGATSPGGPNTSVQFSALGTFAGTANFTWSNGAQLLNVIASGPGAAGINVQNGFIQSATGFVAVPASATTYNAVSALGGGMAANSFTAAKYVQSGSNSGVPTVSGGDSFHAGALYWDTALNTERVFDGSAWQNLTGGGGGGTPGGPNTSVQFNALGTFFGSSNFTWSNGGQVLNIIAASAGSAGVNVQTGFIQSANGFVSLGTTFNTLNAVNGGAAVRSVTATSYVQTGFNGANPGTGSNPLTSGDSLNPGTIFYNTSLGQELLWNGVAWSALGGGGSPGGPSNAIQFNVAGVFGGNANLTFDGVTFATLGTLSVTNSSATFAHTLNTNFISNVGGGIFKGADFIGDGTLGGAGSVVITNNSALVIQSGGVITVPGGVISDGNHPCLAGHVASFSTFQGLITGFTCT